MSSVSVGNPAIRYGAEHGVRAQAADPVAQRDRVRAHVPPLHALQYGVVAGLQAEMEMGHQPGVIPDQIEQLVVDFHRVERRQPEPRQVRHQVEQPPRRASQRRRARQVLAVSR